MAEAHLDHPGEVTWWVGHGPAPVLGDCPHVGCGHRDTATVAWGPDFEHYELVVCRETGPGKCAGGCRGWHAEYPEAQVPPGFPQHRWHTFKAYDPTWEHYTTPGEAEAVRARIAAEQTARRRAAAAQAPTGHTATTLAEDHAAVLHDAVRKLHGDDGLAGV